MSQQFVAPPPANAPNLVKPPAAEPPKPVTPPLETPKPADDKIETPSVKTADILSRSLKPAETTATPPVVEEGMAPVNLDDIKDPAVKALIEKKIKDLESGYNKKYQSVAQARKEVEDLKFKYANWTPQRLAEELRKPEFVQAMQQLQQTAPPPEWTGSAEEYSALSESEKRQMQQMRQEQLSLQAQLAQMKQKEEDAEIKKLYPDFEPQIVDEAIEGLRNGQITASRADIWKVVNHDKNVEKGYQFGYEDGYKKALEKLNGSTALNGSLNVTPADEVPEEVRKAGFGSIATWRWNQKKNGSLPKR